MRGNDNKEEAGSGHNEVVGLHEREAQRDSGKGVRVLQREDHQASDPIGDLERRAQRAVYEVANWVGKRSQYQSGICVLFFNFVLIEVLKQSKILTFIFIFIFLLLFFP